MARSVADFIVDFSKEEEGGGGGVHYKPGTYLMRIAGGKTGISENKSTPYMEVIFVFKEGTYAKKKKKMAERLYITPKSMKRFRWLLEAVGVKVPAKFDAAKIIPKIKNQELYVVIEDEKEDNEEYKDRKRSRVAFEGFISKDDYDPDEEDEDEDLEEDEEEEDELDEEEDDLDEDDDEDEDEEEEEEKPAPKRRSKAKAKPAARKRRKPEPDPEEEDEDEDDDEEEEEERPRSRKSSKSSSSASRRAPKSKKRKAADDDEDEDLDDLDLDNM